MMSVRHVTRFVYMPGLRVHRQSHVCACVSFWKTLPWCGKKKKGSVILKFLFKFLLLHALLWKLIGMPVWKGSRSNVSFWMEVCEMLKHLKTRFLSSLFFCPRLDDAHRFFFFFFCLYGMCWCFIAPDWKWMSMSCTIPHHMSKVVCRWPLACWLDIVISAFLHICVQVKGR